MAYSDRRQPVPGGAVRPGRCCRESTAACTTARPASATNRGASVGSRCPASSAYTWVALSCVAEGVVTSPHRSSTSLVAYAPPADLACVSGRPRGYQGRGAQPRRLPPPCRYRSHRRDRHHVADHRPRPEAGPSRAGSTRRGRAHAPIPATGRQRPGRSDSPTSARPGRS